MPNRSPVYTIGMQSAGTANSVAAAACIRPLAVGSKQQSPEGAAAAAAAGAGGGAAAAAAAWASPACAVMSRFISPALAATRPLSASNALAPAWDIALSSQPTPVAAAASHRRRARPGRTAASRRFASRRTSQLPRRSAAPATSRPRRARSGGARAASTPLTVAGGRCWARPRRSETAPLAQSGEAARRSAAERCRGKRLGRPAGRCGYRTALNQGGFGRFWAFLTLWALIYCGAEDCGQSSDSDADALGVLASGPSYSNHKLADLSCVRGKVQWTTF